ASLFTLEFEALEILNAKRFELIRTPTAAELSNYEDDSESVNTYDIMERTMEEQAALQDGSLSFGDGHQGHVDDWFTLLNLGYPITALGNSDTHGKTSTESGCPRNYVAVSTDDPEFLDDEAIAEAVRQGRVIATYGPFLRFYVDDEANGPGTTLEESGEVTFDIEVQSPTWFDVERVELYRNGTLIEEWSVPSPNEGIVNLETTYQDTPSQDSWYVLIALGSDDLAPVFTPVEIAPIQLQDIVEGALGNVDLGSWDLSELLSTAPIPRTFPVHPYALTNPIWIDRDGDGFDAPGLPTWLQPPFETDSDGGEDTGEDEDEDAGDTGL
ncbi:MAG: CehA/McbA family metallohydrolase, partial [Myxococcota bacterium]|nr:CehA/McbA family metallohydrolase [Myxococcota bacterium]